MKDSHWKVEVIDRQALKQRMGHFAIRGGLVGLEDFESALVKMYDEKELENLALRSLLKMEY
jgi:hypothetical protein